MPVWMILLLALIFFLLGGSVFSFLNVVIFRMPRGEEFVKTRSHCPGCNRVLTPYELVPVFSYLCLGGKCRTCGSKIGLRDVSIEIFGGLLSIASFFLCFQGPVGSMAQGLVGDLYGRFLAALTCLGFFGILTVIGWIGLDTGKLYPGTLIALVILTAVGILTLPPTELLYGVVGFLAVGVIVLLLSLLMKGSFQKGDSLIPGVMGLILGWNGAVMALVFGLVIYVLQCLAACARKRGLPGGTLALSLGGIAALLGRLFWIVFA